MSWGLFSDRDFCISSAATPDTIGPGKYDVPPLRSEKKPMSAPFGSRLESRTEPTPNDAPDPGQYEAKPLENPPSTKYIFSSKAPRRVFPEKENVPGPTAYQQLDDWIRAPGKPYKHKPEPASRPMTGFVGQDVSGYALNKEGELMPVKIQFKEQCDIGPCTYEAPQLRVPTPIYIDRPSNRDLYGEIPDVPGPGAYTETHFQSKMLHKINEKRKEKEPEFEYPQFLVHDPWISETSPLTKACFKSRTERGIFKVTESGPPPDAYSEMNDSTSLLKSSVSRAQTAFGVRTGRNDFWGISETPGPGAYNPKGIYWIKKGQRPGRHAIEKNNIPSEDHQETPGPGSYDWSEHKESRPSSVFLTRTERVLQNEHGMDAPGPGHYTPTFDPTQVPKKMNASKRFNANSSWEIQTDAPPVGTYNPKQEETKGRTISRIGHRPLYHKTCAPGPGKYEITHQSFLRHSYNTSVPI